MKTEPTFNQLIDRLEYCSSINHPDRLWSAESKVNIANEWIGKYDELKKRVETLEVALNKEEQ